MLGLAGCAVPGIGGGSGRGSAASATTSPLPASPSPTVAATPSLPANVWVLTPLGLHLRSDPGEASAVIGVLPQGSKLSVVGSRAVGAERWLQVKDADSGKEGWVLDQPDLLIALAISRHVDDVNGYQVLVPASWAPGQPAGRPGQTTFTGHGPGGESDILTVDVADDLGHLLKAPTAAGQELRREGPVLVYGQTTQLTVYQLQGGGFEIADRFVWSPPAPSPGPSPAPPSTGGNRAFLFLLLQSGSGSDSAGVALFEQILAGVIVN